MPPPLPSASCPRKAQVPAAFIVARSSSLNCEPAGVGSFTRATRRRVLPFQVKNPSGPPLAVKRKPAAPASDTPTGRKLVNVPPPGENSPVRAISTSPPLPSVKRPVGASSRGPVKRGWPLRVAARGGTPTSVTSRPSESRSPATRRGTSPLPPAVKSPLEVPTNATRPAASMVGSEKLERMPIGEGSPALATRRGSTAPAAGAASHRTSSSDARTISGAMPASPVPPRPRHGRGGFDHGRRAAPCRAAAIVHRCTTLVPKLAYQLREPVEGRAAVDPPLARAPPPLRALDVAELGEPRERVAEGDDRAALPLVHLAEQATRGELPTHPLDERPLGDRPFLLPRHGAGRHEIGLAEVFEHARGRAHERVGGLHDVAHERTRLAVVGEESGDLAAEGVAVGQRELPAIEVEPPRHVGLQRLGRDSREQAARHQRRDQ